MQHLFYLTLSKTKKKEESASVCLVLAMALNTGSFTTAGTCCCQLALEVANVRFWRISLPTPRGGDFKVKTGISIGGVWIFSGTQWYLKNSGS